MPPGKTAAGADFARKSAVRPHRHKPCSAAGKTISFTVKHFATLYGFPGCFIFFILAEESKSCKMFH